MGKQPRKVALINVHDYSHEKYTAYYEIRVLEGEGEGFVWGVRVYDRSTGNLVEETLDGAPDRDSADTAAQIWAKEHMEKYRRKGLDDLQRFENKSALHGYAIPLPVDLITNAVREAIGGVYTFWDKYVKPLLALAYAAATRNNRLNQVRDAIDAGAGAGLLRIYDGVRPATCGTATTLLAELTFSDPCAAAASGGVLTMSAITADASANATGTASWFRCVDSTGTCAVDGNVGTTGSDLNLNSTSINLGVQVSVTSFTITAGNS